MKVKVKDIAQAAGVSTTAVSLVLNGKPSRLSEATKEKIIRIARELAFQNEYSLQSASHKKVQTLGLILPSIREPFYLRLAEEIERRAYNMGYTVLTSFCENDLRRCCAAVEGVAMKNVDGILFVAPSTSEKDDQLTKILKVLLQNAIPMVLIDRAVYSVFCDFVTSDNKYGGKAATLYLAEQGHEKIGCLCGPQNIYTARKRFQGYREGLASVKQEFREDCIYYGDLTAESGKAGAERLYERGCTAIFVANDLMTEGAVAFAREHGLSIPKELAIVGYDGTAFGVPCVQQNVALIAEKAVDLVLEQISEGPGKTPSRNFYITPVLSGAD